MSEKTEQPTSKKLSDERKKGNLSISKDVVSTFIFCLVLLYVTLSGQFFYSLINKMAVLGFDFQSDYSKLIRIALESIATIILYLTSGLFVCSLVGVLIGSLIQNKFSISFEPLIPKLNKLNPIQGAKNLFSIKSLINILKLLFISVLLFLVIFHAIKTNLNTIILIVHSPLNNLLTLSKLLLLEIILPVILIYIIQAVFDFVIQKHFYIKNLKMSKEDIKKEYIQSEGDPHTKGKRKQLHQEILQDKMMQNVKKASVVIVNPEHYAVAILYNEDQHDLPIVVAKGQNEIALLIKRTAELANVPILRNIKLARQLYGSTEIDAYIPSEMITPIAEVLKWVKRIEDEKLKKYNE